MNIGIVGYGAVGEACARGFEHIGHSVIPHDIKLNSKLSDLIDSEIVFICVPTPVGPDNSCDTSIVESCVKQIKEINYKGVICIKSTVEPGTTSRLSKKYDLNLCFVPEFLRERCAYIDFVDNHDLLAIGSLDERSQRAIIKAHGKLPKNIKILKPSEAELLKYFSNSYNAMKVIFANNFFELANSLESDYKAILDAYLVRKSNPSDYLKVDDDLRGYSGVCLPKDVKALIALAEKLNIDLKLFESIDSDNDKLKITVFEGMRKE